MPELQIRLLGGFQFSRGNIPIAGFISNKVVALLVYLAVTQRAHSRDKLASLLWGEMSDADARNNLRQALTNLRKVADDCLTITRDSIEFTGECFLDSFTFEQDIKTASSLRPEPASVKLTESLSLYRGDFLEGLILRDAPDFEDWILTERARLRELALQALHTLTQYHNERGDYTAAMMYASRLLAFDPWREEAHRQRMLALVRAGQRSAALAQYQTCRRILAKELGVEPSTETSALYEQIRTAENLSLHNLPVSTTSFIGREAELQEIKARLLDPNCRLLTLIGHGGAGKTRLALQAARAQVNTFLGGIWYIPLASVEDFDGLLLSIARAIKFESSGGDSLGVQLRQHLQDKNLLLILDNMEHLINESVLSWIAETLQSSFHLKILVTSLERLNILTETLLEVHGLIYKMHIPDEAGTALLTYPAPMLFLDRARRLKPNFNPDTEDAIAIARLCQLVEGSPLALELSAAWVRGLPTQEIVKELERNLDILTTARPDLSQRHQSMQAVFDYFWQLLSPEEQVVLKKQAVFRGGFTREAFLAVTNTDIAMLARLVDKSAFNFSEEGRYRRHPLMAKFSAARLADDPELEAESRERHTRYFSHFVKCLEPELLGGQPQKALTPLLADLHNIRLAWDWAVEHHDAFVFNEMSDSIMQIFDLSGLYRDAHQMAVRATEALDTLTGSLSDEVKIAQGRVMGLAGAFLFRMGEYQKAQDWCEKSLQALEEARPHIAYAHTLIYAGASAFGLGDFERVISNWKSAAKEYQTINSRWGDMTASANLAEVMITTSNFADGKLYAEHALALAREMNNLEMMGAALTNIAILAMQEERFLDATKFAEEALNSHQQVGHDAHIANSLAVLAQIAFKQDDLDEARRLLEESTGILKRVGNRLYLEQRTQELNEVLSAQSQ